MAFKLKIEPLAKFDIQTEINYYNTKQKGLGKRFHAEVKTYFDSIKSNPFYQIRYDDIHCLPLKTFSAMIHFTIDELNNCVTIRAVVNTNKNPDTNWII